MGKWLRVIHNFTCGRADLIWNLCSQDHSSPTVWEQIRGAKNIICLAYIVPYFQQNNVEHSCPLYSPFEENWQNPPEEEGELGNPSRCFESVSPTTSSCSLVPPKSPGKIRKMHFIILWKKRANYINSHTKLDQRTKETCISHSWAMMQFLRISF